MVELRTNPGFTDESCLLFGSAWVGNLYRNVSLEPAVVGFEDKPRTATTNRFQEFVAGGEDVSSSVLKWSRGAHVRGSGRFESKGNLGEKSFTHDEIIFFIEINFKIGLSMRLSRTQFSSSSLGCGNRSR